MPNENARPRKACGKAKKRLVNGYTTAITTAGNDSSTVVRLVARTRRNARNASTAATSSASQGAIAPVASGRSAVRFTCGSKCRSAQSFTAQPAERMSSVPIVNTMSCTRVGRPAAAIHSAASVGQSSSSVPIGLSSRTRRS